MLPLVTIGMIAEDSGEFISKAIESVLEQTYQNWELVIVDNFSADSSYEIALEYTNADSRIRAFKEYIKKERRELTEIMMQEAEGDMFTQLHAKDKFHKEKLRLQVEKLLQDEDIMRTFCGCQWMREEVRLPQDEPNSLTELSWLTHYQDPYHNVYIMSEILYEQRVLW